MTQEIVKYTNLLDLIPSVRDAVISPCTKRSYASSLAAFIKWNDGAELTRPRVLEYRQSLLDRGLASASVNLALCAIRKLAEEAALQGYLDERTAYQIRDIAKIPNAGRRFGNWLSQEQLVEMLMKPDQSTLTGQRDFLLLGLMAGCGLRIAEVCALTTDHIQRRECRMAILDFMGKGRKLRTVALPQWLEGPTSSWIERIGHGPLIRQMDRLGEPTPLALHDRRARRIIVRYAEIIGVKCAPHDLRRTFALTAMVNGANLESIRQALGHATLVTTSRYVESGMALKKPACDFVL